MGCPSITFDSLDSGQLFSVDATLNGLMDMSVGEVFGGAGQNQAWL